MRETASVEENRNTVSALLAWAKRAEDDARWMERAGKKVHFQGSRGEGNKADELSLYSCGGTYSFCVNGRTRYTARSLSECVDKARAAGYFDELSAIEIVKGKAVADREREKRRLRAMINGEWQS